MKYHVNNMGAENSILSDIQIEQECHSVEGRLSSIHSAKQKDGTKVTVFVYDSKNTSIDSTYFENSVQTLRVLRHPSIVRYLAADKSTGKNVLLTEPILPLDAIIDKLSSTEIIAGIFSIIEAIQFIHTLGGICHNNICAQSVFVAEDGCWKLGGFEYSCHFKDASLNYLEKCRPFRYKDGIPPEEKIGKLSSKNVYARDIYAFGIFAESIFSYLKDLGNKIKSFEDCICQDCQNLDPDKRPNIESLSHNEIFSNDFIEIKKFLSGITIKSEHEKENFFTNVVPKLLTLPNKVVASCLLRPLLSRFVILEKSAQKYLLPSLLTPLKNDQMHNENDVMPILSEALFRQFATMEIFKIFYVRDASIRIILLQFFPCYIKYMDHNILMNFILPQILLGIRDTNDQLVSLSLQALSHLVPILGGDIVIGTQRSKFFKSGDPKPPKKILGTEPQISHEVNSLKCPLLEKESLLTVQEKANVSLIEENSSEQTEQRKKTLREIASEANLLKRKEELVLKRNERRKKYEENKQITQFESEAELDIEKIGNLDDDNPSSDGSSSDISVRADTKSISPISLPTDVEMNVVECANIESLCKQPKELKISTNIEDVDFYSPKAKLSPITSQFDNYSSDQTYESFDLPLNDCNVKYDAWNMDWNISEYDINNSKSLSDLNQNMPLGSEFKIDPIDVNKVCDTNGSDFFLDMEPIIPKKLSFLETLAVVSDAKQGSKFGYDIQDNESRDVEVGHEWGEDWE